MAELNIEKGEMNLAGININLAEIMGGKIVDQYFAQLDEEHMSAILNYINDTVFEEKKFNWQDIKIKEKTGYYYNDQTLMQRVKNEFAKQTQDMLMEKVKEIIESQNFKDQVDEIANELVQYAIEGYKEDLQKYLREKLVYNVLRPEPTYGGMSLSSYIEQTVRNILNI